MSEVRLSPEASRLPPPKSFAEASAMVDAALGQLRKTEASLEQQLFSLRDYLAASQVSVAVLSQ